MKNLLDDFNKPFQEPPLSDREVFMQIWTQPRKVFRFIDDYGYEKYLIPLLVLAGISRAFERASNQNTGEDNSLILVISLAIIVGGLFGWISYYFYSRLLSWTGRWLDGIADGQSILRVLTYGLLPSILGLFFVFIQVLIFGKEVFVENATYQGSNILTNIVFWGAVIAQLILSIYSLILIVIGLSVVQRFGIGKAILNLLLPVLIFVIPIVLILVIVT